MALCQQKFLFLDLILVLYIIIYRKDVPKMKIAVITGASSGLGAEFAFETEKQLKDIEEIWLIARREDKLKELADKINCKTRIVPLDITDPECQKEYEELLKEENADVRLLINNAGFGKLGNFDELTPEDNGGMVRLN